MAAPAYIAHGRLVCLRSSHSVAAGGVDVHTRMWYGNHDDLPRGNWVMRFLTLEVDFLVVLQGFFPYLFLPFTSLRIPWAEPRFG